MKDALDKFYELSARLSDDVYSVAHCIRQYHPEPMYVSRIMLDCAEPSIDRMEKFETTLERLLDLSDADLNQMRAGITFQDESVYIGYLHGILDTAGVFYLPFNKRGGS